MIDATLLADASHGKEMHERLVSALRQRMSDAPLVVNTLDFLDLLHEEDAVLLISTLSHLATLDCFKSVLAALCPFRIGFEAVQDPEDITAALAGVSLSGLCGIVTTSHGVTDVFFTSRAEALHFRLLLP